MQTGLQGTLQLAECSWACAFLAKEVFQKVFRTDTHTVYLVAGVFCIMGPSAFLYSFSSSSNSTAGPWSITFGVP